MHVQIPRHIHFTAIRGVGTILQRVLGDLRVLHLPLPPPPLDIACKVGQRRAEAASLGQWMRLRVPGAASSATLDELSVPDAVFQMINFTVTAVVELSCAPSVAAAESAAAVTAAAIATTADGPAEPATLREAALLERFGFAASRHPVLRARVVRVGARCYWLPDGSFDPLKHVSCKVLGDAAVRPGESSRPPRPPVPDADT